MVKLAYGKNRVPAAAFRAMKSVPVGFDGAGRERDAGERVGGWRGIHVAEL